jgi:hypothetical protein
MKTFVKTAAAAALVSGFCTSASAGTVTVPYFGAFDEATVAGPVDGLPAGDYDTIGGLDDVGLFQLVAGTNTFEGSIFAPTDTADVFLVEVLAGFVLTGATINWGTNLPNNFGAPVGEYLYQSTGRINQPQAPSWFFEESSPTPEIFTINNLWDSPWGEAPAEFSSPTLSVGAGIYSSLIADQASGSCVLQQFIRPEDGFIGERCVEGLDYTMTFTVEQINVPVPEVSATGSLAAFASLFLFGTFLCERRGRDELAT